jgi:hypothetical protein
MSANHSASEHGILVVRVGGHRGKDALPHARLGPSGKALVDRLVFAVTLRQVVPVGTDWTTHKPRSKAVVSFVAFGFHGDPRPSNLEPHESYLRPVPETLNVDSS